MEIDRLIDSMNNITLSAADNELIQTYGLDPRTAGMLYLECDAIGKNYVKNVALNTIMRYIGNIKVYPECVSCGRRDRYIHCDCGEFAFLSHAFCSRGHMLNITNITCMRENNGLVCSNVIKIYNVIKNESVEQIIELIKSTGGRILG